MWAYKLYTLLPTFKITDYENKIKKEQRSNKIDCYDTISSNNTNNANKFNFAGYTTKLFRFNVLCWMGLRVIFIVGNACI